MSGPYESRSAPDAPFFFLSYAHVPLPRGHPDELDQRLVDFHGHLFDLIMQLTTIDAADSAAFLDRRIPLGAEWEKHLKHALATCQVFVPVYSPRYFGSEWCGKEWDAFERRQRHHRESRPHTVTPIVPVWWLPPERVRVPAVARRLQHTHIDLSVDYRQKGLFGLVAEGRRTRYRQAVWGIAQAIVDVAETARLDPCDVALFDDLRNVFEGDQ
ncbi:MULTISPECIES: TIR-like protein FxsC [unclassified Streptomyces]|uniref:TIR-like protein FxsC n=1 Tax=unclassified Streptomyces TaxID=2593676 RepID=UPI00190CFD2D|nr:MULTISPECIES: TIR-like protein FxsC [unclassified Streptomyces]MBK3569599.1 toll/interleukin-1 receptor domain-containing protein [Streptomyces sp. MBT62]MBK6015895.1 toll/interleukin-1 receptor domain-containing protein [Streptomyces sp. MBT53]